MRSGLALTIRSWPTFEAVSALPLLDHKRDNSEQKRDRKSQDHRRVGRLTRLRLEAQVPAAVRTAERVVTVRCVRLIGRPCFAFGSRPSWAFAAAGSRAECQNGGEPPGKLSQVDRKHYSSLLVPCRGLAGTGEAWSCCLRSRWAV